MTKSLPARSTCSSSKPLVARGRLQGYEIAESILSCSDEVLQVEEGSLYPALQRMLIQGWVTAEWGVTAGNRRARALLHHHRRWCWRWLEEPWAIAFAAMANRILLRMISQGAETIPLDVSLNLPLLGFTCVISICTALLFGTLPAIRATRLELTESLKSGRGGSAGTARSSLARILVVAQVAISLLLMVGACLFTRTLINLSRISTGFNPDHVLIPSEKNSKRTIPAKLRSSKKTKAVWKPCPARRWPASPHSGFMRGAGAAASASPTCPCTTKRQPQRHRR